VIFLATDDHQNRINELLYSPAGETGVQASYVRALTGTMTQSIEKDSVLGSVPLPELLADYIAPRDLN